MAMTMYEVGVATPLRCMKCKNAERQYSNESVGTAQPRWHSPTNCINL